MSLFRQGTLAQQTSQMFQMTLDELQNSLQGSGNIGSMNLVRLLLSSFNLKQSAWSDIAMTSPNSPLALDRTFNVTPSPRTVLKTFMQLMWGLPSPNAFQSRLEIYSTVLDNLQLNTPAGMRHIMKHFKILFGSHKQCLPHLQSGFW